MKQNIFIPVLLFFGMAMFSGCVSIKGETAGEYIDDSTITTQINGVIIKDPDAQYLKIDVKTIQGDVVLQGFVNNRDTEDRLIEKIGQIRGVRTVKSLLKME